MNKIIAQNHVHLDTKVSRLDRDRWPAVLCFSSYGRRIGIRSNDSAVLDRLPPILPPGWELVAGPLVDCTITLCSRGNRAEHRLYVDRRLAKRSAELDCVLQALESEVQMFVAEHAQNRVFVHAGVVGWKGRALLLPGRSMAGKSTLIEALVRAGATYYSDEYAVLDDAGQVYPYARRLSLRDPEASPLSPTRRCTAGDLGGACGAGPIPAAVVAVTKYREGQRWRPRSLNSGQTFVELMHNTVPALTHPDRVLTALQHLAPKVRSLKSWRGEAKEVVDALLCEVERG